MYSQSVRRVFDHFCALEKNMLPQCKNFSILKGELFLVLEKCSLFVFSKIKGDVHS